MSLEPGAEGTRSPRQRSWLTRGVASVGLASFFSDSGHEIATSVLPTFVTVTLRSSVGVLGLIEGISDALTGVAKVFSGPFANDETRRAEMASGGYLVTAAATASIGLATAVWQVGLARAAAWTARGVRSRPGTRCSPRSRRAKRTAGRSAWSGPATISGPSWGRCSPPPSSRP